MVLAKKHLKMRHGEKRKQIPMTAPEEAKIALQLHAETMTEAVYSLRTKSKFSVSDANLDLLYSTKAFQSYLPEARRIIKKRNQLKDQQQYEFQQQDSQDTSPAPH